MARVSSFGVRLAGVAVIAAVAAVGGYFAYRAYGPKPAAPPVEAPDDPRLTWDTPFRNVRPEVAYVGDAACAACHDKIAKSYAKHPMGRSMAPTSAESEREPRSPQAHNPFEKYGNRFSVAEHDGKVFHRVERLGADDKPVTGFECEAKYVVGSGTRGKSYLVEREGRLFQSPISWFHGKDIWDLSPGYIDSTNFNRPINGRCLVCHCNRADPEDGPMNNFRSPIFQGYSIGCERCHGPGELHVKLREGGQKAPVPDYSIVNPKHLDPGLAEMVCQQCHLQGEDRVLRRGRQPFDFRPGLPLHLFLSVYVRAPELMTNFHSVGHLEQLHRSRCYQGTAGKLGCVSCHDPHHQPEPEERVAFYRGRCLQCHQSRGCSLPAAERRKQHPDDSCIACHMSTDGSHNIPHTAVTDHRILRRPEPGEGAKPHPLEAGAVPIVNFHRDRPEFEPREANRDLGLALAKLSEREGPVSSGLSSIALGLLSEAVRAHPDDAAAWEARSAMLWGAGRLPQALEGYEKALALNPKMEVSLLSAATICELLQRKDPALDFRRRLLEVNPYMPIYHLHLAQLYGRRGEWARANAACEEAVKLEPINVEARMFGVTCLVRVGERDKAKAEFDTLLAMRPGNEAELRRAFAALMN